MSDLRELYQSVIIDHSKRPRNFSEPEGMNRRADGFNPLCGDKLTVFLSVEDGVVTDVGFGGSGCAISVASASLMTEAIKGKTVDEAREIFEDFHNLLTTEAAADAEPERLGKLTVFAGVREFPVRVKCATLAWHTLVSALTGSGNVATTE
jgi:nitrogen fixation NifU-like protein